MNVIQKRRIIHSLFIFSILISVAGLIMYALRQNINLFFTPAQLDHHHMKVSINQHQPMIRVGGIVVKGSLIHLQDSLGVEFKITDFKKTLTVHYQGILPDLFREGQGIVTTGYLKNHGLFKAVEVLAKHDANYMPPPIRASIASFNQSPS